MAYHTIKETNCYHIYSDCVVGNNIEPENKKAGTGGYSLCSYCAKRQKSKKRK